MKNTVKIISALLAVVMMLLAFASCEPADQPKPVDTKPAQTDAPQTQAATEAPGTEPATEAPATTEEETEEPPKDDEWYDVYRWTFDDPKDIGWEAGNMTSLESSENGELICTITGADPHIDTAKIPTKIMCEDVGRIVIRVKNLSDSYTCQLFTSTTLFGGPAEAYSGKFDYMYGVEDSDEGEWEEIIIDTEWELGDGWGGRLKSLRFDYSEAGEGEVWIDYIALQTTDKSKAADPDAAVTEEPDLRAGKQVVYTIDYTKIPAEKIWLSSADHGEDEAPEDVWSCSKGISDMRVENDYMVIEVGGQDPFCASPAIEEDIATEGITCMVITVCNRTDNKMAQVFYTTEFTTSWAEGASEKYTYTKSGADNTEFEEIVIDLSEATQWNGALTGIRFDPTEAWSGEVWIKSIEFYG